MKRYLVPINTTRLALKKITKIHNITLTDLQERFAINIGYTNWKELIFINNKTTMSNWISYHCFHNIVENLFKEDLEYINKIPIISILSKIFMIDFLCLKEIYHHISNDDYYTIKNSLFNAQNKELDNVITINSPIILNNKSNDLYLEDKNILSRCFSPKPNDFIYIQSDNVIYDFQDIINECLRTGLKYYIINCPYDEKNIRTLCRLMFSGHIIVLSGSSALEYKENMNKWIMNFKRNL